MSEGVLGPGRVATGPAGDSGSVNTLTRAHLRAREVGAVLHSVSPAGQVVALWCRTEVDQLLLHSASAATRAARSSPRGRGARVWGREVHPGQWG
ncbi:hypothetical protein GCM10025734_03450 [Kitasatospora paranensis]